MNTCVCCGAPIPEGTQVCPRCSKSFIKIEYRK
jgi:predicted nucleic acid-binding Zn ribbon protein